MRFPTRCVMLVGLGLASGLLAHSGSLPSTESPEGSPQRIELPRFAGPGRPWTHDRFPDPEEEFHFAIVADRTGGARPGVFESSIDRLNLLRPELVLSVGDQIEGYTEDPAAIEAEWTQFRRMVDRLHAPYFHVPGNHDFTNAAEATAWRERMGAPYYSFVYCGVLFLCLNSYEAFHHALPEPQVDWALGELARESKVRWTLVFLHTPLWDGEVGKRDPGWERLEPALLQRPSTTFAGHTHSYLQTVRQDRRFINLATTGGGSALRGTDMGEFDHVAWVTMTREGPVLANLLLSGIFPEDVRTADQRRLREALCRGGAMLPLPPVYAATTALREGTWRAPLRNVGRAPIVLEYRLVPTGPVDLVSSAPPRLTLEPGQEQELVLSLALPTALPEDEGPIAHLVWSATTREEDRAVRIQGRSPIEWVHPRPVARAEQAPRIDGDLGDWPKLAVEVAQARQRLDPANVHRGPADARFAFDLRADAENLYLAVAVEDDQVIAQPGLHPWTQDGIEIRIDARPDAERGQVGPGDEGQAYTLLALSPGDRDPGWKGYLADRLPRGTRFVCLPVDGGYVAEIAIPRAALFAAQSGPQPHLRLNVQIDDTDPGESRVQLNWQPDWSLSPEAGAGTGTFVLPPEGGPMPSHARLPS